jgi:octopine/nopaline transport system permease protein
MDFAFLSQTMVTLLAALPMTLGLFICSITLGGVLALLLVWMRTSGIPRIAAADPDVSGIQRP